MEKADHCSPDVVQRDEGEAPIGQVDEPFLITIGRMETTVYDPTQAIPSDNKPIYCHYNGWKPLEEQNKIIKLDSIKTKSIIYTLMEQYYSLLVDSTSHGYHSNSRTHWNTLISYDWKTSSVTPSFDHQIEISILKHIS